MIKLKWIIIPAVLVILCSIALAPTINEFYDKLVQFEEFKDIQPGEITQKIVTDIPLNWTLTSQEFPFGLDILSYQINKTHLYLVMNASLKDYPNQPCTKPSQGYVKITNAFYNFFDKIEYAEWNHQDVTAQFIKTTSKVYNYKPTYVKNCYENTLFKLRLQRNSTATLPNKFFLSWGTASTQYEIRISEGLRYAVYYVGDYNIKEISWKHQKEIA